MSAPYAVLWVTLAFGVYTYVGYPLLLKLLGLARRPRPVPHPPARWPLVTVTIPVYNEEAVIRGKLEAVLASTASALSRWTRPWCTSRASRRCVASTGAKSGR